MLGASCLILSESPGDGEQFCQRCLRWRCGAFGDPDMLTGISQPSIFEKMELLTERGDGEHNGAFAGVVARSVTQICSLEYLNLVTDSWLNLCHCRMMLSISTPS